VSVLPPSEEKATYVERMFARIAPGYDRINRTMTFGQDQRWRQHAVDAVAPPINGRALDVGTGTGDFLPLLAAWMPDGIAVGVDFCLPMMHAGWSKLAPIAPTSTADHSLTHKYHANFVGGDALRLPFPDDTFDSITTGFTMRNVIDIGAAFREMWRIARPGGVVACLEVARPRNPLLRLGHRLYFEQVVPLVGLALGSDRQAYTYLPQSARLFPVPPELAQIMRDAGWQHVQYKRLSLGVVAVHTGVKL
jgi:demethylmenaquinone methyltransferase/2-methoxy-6-polyprenyl-1,4-benzoquinol methylase